MNNKIAGVISGLGIVITSIICVDANYGHLGLCVFLLGMIVIIASLLQEEKTCGTCGHCNDYGNCFPESPEDGCPGMPVKEDDTCLFNSWIPKGKKYNG